MFCIECGTQLSLQAKFCRHCGTPADAGGATVNVTKPANLAGKSIEAKVEPALAAVFQLASQEELYRAVVGEKSHSFYVNDFLALDRSKKAPTAWNWAAFFGLFWWLLYRRMWKNAAICYLLLLSTATVFIWDLKSSDNPRLVAAVWLLTWLFMRIIAGGAGTEIYYSHCKKKILAEQAKGGAALVQTLAQAGGVSRTVPLVIMALSSMLTGMVGWGISSSYRDYETKAQVEISSVRSVSNSPYGQYVPSQVDAEAGGAAPAASGESGHRHAPCRPASNTSMYEALFPPCEPLKHQ